MTIPPLPKVLVDSWTDADGQEHKVKTVQNSGESQAAFTARHNDVVVAGKALYPGV